MEAVRDRLSAKDRYWRGRLALRSLSTALCLATIIAFSLSLHLYTKKPAYYHVDRGDSIDFMPLAAVCWCLLWNAANIIYSLSKARPMHPGWNVAVELVSWLALVILAAFAHVAGRVFVVYEPAEAPYIRLEATGFVLTYLLSGLHLALFAYACREEDQRRKRVRRKRKSQLQGSISGANASPAANAVVDSHECNGQPIKLDSLRGHDVGADPTDQPPSYSLPTPDAQVPGQEKGSERV